MTIERSGRVRRMASLFMALALGIAAAGRAEAHGKTTTTHLSRPPAKVKPTPAERITGDGKSLAAPAAKPVKFGSSSLLASDRTRRLTDVGTDGEHQTRLRVKGGAAPAATKLERLGGQEANLAGAGHHPAPILHRTGGDNRIERLHGLDGTQSSHSPRSPRN